MTETTGIRETRERLDMSLRELARRTGINPGRLSVIERGVLPTDDERAAILTALDAANAQTPTAEPSGVTA